MFAQLHERICQQLQRPAGPSWRWIGAGGGDQQSLLLTAELALRSWPILFGQCHLQALLHEAALGSVHGGFAHCQGGGNACVVLLSMGRKQDLGAFDLAGRMLACAEQCAKHLLLGCSQFDSVA